jgi:hypothetical protein
MAKRKQLWHPDEVRQKIQASQLINRLTAHVNSKTPLMDSSQVTAAVKLLGKVLPDLQSTALTNPDGGALTISVQRFADSNDPS